MAGGEPGREPGTGKRVPDLALTGERAAAPNLVNYESLFNGDPNPARTVILPTPGKPVNQLPLCSAWHTGTARPTHAARGKKKLKGTVKVKPWLVSWRSLQDA